MDGRSFDELIRKAGEATSRRGALGLVLGSVAAAAVARIEPALGRKKKGKGKGKGKGKNKRCKKLNQICGGKKKCCNGFVCVDGTCACPIGTIASDGKCINPDEPECTVNNECGINELCQNGECVLQEFECASDDDCDNNEDCIVGTCVCQEIEDGRCIRRCENGSDAECPGAASCRNLSPSQSQGFVDGVCVNEAFFLCDTTPCTTNTQCAGDEVCVMLSCEGAALVGRCQEIAVF